MIAVWIKIGTFNFTWCRAIPTLLMQILEKFLHL